MSEIRIRSPILAKMPETRVGITESARRVSKRIVIFGPIIGLLMVFSIAVWLRLLPKRGLGWLLYAIHDTFFLPIKGYTFTKFYPFSLVWWIIILVVLGLIAASLLLDRSFLKRPHVWLLRRLMNHANLYWFLIGGSRFFNRLGLQPHLIRLVARRELEAALITLSAQPLQQAAKIQCRRVSDLTRLDMQLERYFSPFDLSVFRILERWQHSYLLIHAYGDNSKKWFPSILTDMFEVFDSYDFTVIEAVRHKSNRPVEATLFDPFVLLQEIITLRELGDELSIGKKVEPDDQRCLALLRRIDARRKLLHTTAHKIQYELMSKGGSLRPEFTLPWLVQTELQLAIAGRLALLIALHLSLFIQDTNLAEMYTEAMDELNLFLDANTIPSSSLDRLRYLMFEPVASKNGAVQDVPTWQAYRLLAALNTKRLFELQDEWDPLINDSDGPVYRNDFELAHWSVERMWSAAGPISTQEDWSKGGS